MLYLHIIRNGYTSGRMEAICLLHLFSHIKVYIKSATASSQRGLALHPWLPYDLSQRVCFHLYTLFDVTRRSRLVSIHDLFSLFCTHYLQSLSKLRISVIIKTGNYCSSMSLIKNVTLHEIKSQFMWDFLAIWALLFPTDNDILDLSSCSYWKCSIIIHYYFAFFWFFIRNQLFPWGRGVGCSSAQGQGSNPSV